MTTPARAEREALSDLLIELGPDAPTRCGEWTTGDLAAHLAIRERRPDAAVGILVKPLQGYSEGVRRSYARQPWDDLVAQVRSGPPVWSPTRLDAVDRLANTVEYFVHHEDVRRMQPGWEPRSLDPALEADLAGALARMGKLLGRRSPCGLILAPDGRDHIVAKKGEPHVDVAGPVGELVLFMYGRQDVARVGMVGPDDLVEAVHNAPFGV
jgi:uncharacterized protein (TIGR03085 family)